MTGSESQEDVWGNILGLTSGILEKAKLGAWDEATALDSERRSLLEAFFNSPPQGELARRVTADILFIRESDRQVMELARQMRTAIGEELHHLRQGHKAAGAYLEQSGE